MSWTFQMWRRRKRLSPSKIEQRLSRLPDHEILGWAENSMYAIGRSLYGNSDQLADAEQNAEVLLVAVRIMRTRRGMLTG